MYFRKVNKITKECSLDTIINEEQNATLMNVIEEKRISIEDEIIKREEFIETLSIILNVLDGKERLIILFKMAGIKQQEVSSVFNISQSYISRLQKITAKKIKLYYNKKYKKNFIVSFNENWYTIIPKNKNWFNERINEEYIKIEENTIFFIPDKESIYYIAKILKKAEEKN